MVGADGVEPPEPEDSRFTVCPATTYGLNTHILEIRVRFELTTYNSFAGCPLEPLGYLTILAWTTGLEPAHRLHDYCQFSKLLPYLLGLHPHYLFWRELKDSNLYQRFWRPSCYHYNKLTFGTHL